MRILVIEDNPKLAHSLREGLEGQSYSVDVCLLGYEGEERALIEDYDLILLDLMLPDRDGLEVCRNLRRSQVDTPIVVLTALGQTSQKVAGLDAGADDYMTKPFEFEELYARVRALLRRNRASEGDRLKVADLELDLHRRRALRDEEAINLSTREFALLEFLMRNPERVLDRITIVEKVWDMRDEPTSNVVDVYISQLRRKIDREFEPKLIHTVIGAGYRLGLPD